MIIQYDVPRAYSEAFAATSRNPQEQQDKGGFIKSQVLGPLSEIRNSLPPILWACQAFEDILLGREQNETAGGNKMRLGCRPPQEGRNPSPAGPGFEEAGA